ncbi:MAG TPA: secretin N-terminal domain-containing protein, partial [Phycisphaerae bacterium]|nr:secretin N-terminal domain-containing protein [Phycisphaerae bacterium]
MIRKFAQACKKPLLGEVEIPGSLTFFDSEPYCYEEALDTLNILLNMRGFALIEFKRYLRVVQVTELANNASILRGLDQVGDIRNEQVVTVLLPVENLDPEAASKAIVRMVSSYGSITPMPRGKGVLITDRLSSVRRIQDMIQMLDAERATASDIKTIQIKKASAKSVASVINQVLGGPSSSPERRSSSAPPASSGDSVSAYSDDRTNLLFLRGVGAKLQLAEQLVEKLDSEATSDVSDMRLIELKNARAEDVAKTISEVMPRDQIQVAGPPSSDSSRRHYPVTVAKGKVVAEPETNRLIVSAPLDVMVKIEELIKKLDVASDTSGGVKVLRLKTADAAQLAPIVSAAVAKQTLAAGGARRGMVTVTADSRTNSLVIVGPAGDIQAAEKLVAELDRPLDKEEERQIRIIQLPSGNAEKLASAISRVLDSSPSSHYGSSRYGSSSSRSQTSRPRIEADSGTNSLLISAAPSDWPQIESILKQIIPPPPPDQPAAATPLALTTPVLRHVPLKFAKAEDLATTLLSVFGTRRRSEAVSIIITPSARTNSLLISAAEPDQIAMGELIKTLDVDSSEKLDPVRIVELKVADAAKVADAIQAVLPPRPVGRRGETHQVTIHADTATNTLFIRAGEAEQKLIDEVIARMDKGAIDPTIVRETRIIALKFVPASQMAASVQQFFQSAGGSPSSPYGSSYYRRRSYSSASGEKAFDSLVVAAAPGDQALIVEGPKKKVDEVAAFVAKLDTQDTGQATIVRVYTLKEADAGEISRTLSATFSKKWQDQKRRDPKLADPEPSFEINAGANQLIIAATEKQLTEIDALIAQLEKAPAVTSQTKTFPLKHAKAEELVNVLQTMLTSGAPSPYSGYAYSRRSRSVEGELKIAAIAASNSLVIQGPPAKMAKAEQLIASFDTPQAGESSLISIVPLKAASASQLAVTLKNMLPPQSRERESELVIQADTASNSLLIRASATQRKIIDELIPKLDVELAEGTREMRVVPVMFVSASQIAQTVSQVFRGQNGTSSSSSSYRRSYYRSYDAPQAGPGSDEILITPAPNDRSIVIEAPKKKIEPIVQLIATLDVAEGTAKANQIRTYQLKNANAAEVSRVLSGMYTQRTSGYGEAPSARGGSGPTATPPKFDHDTATNQLVVSASDEQFVEIDALIKKLEEAPQLATQTKTFPLKHVRASEVLPVLTNLLSETPASTPEGYAGYSPYSSRRRYGASASSELRLAALPGANSIVAQGPPPKMLKVEQLIASFDTPQAGESSLITMVPLKNASAAKLAETLKSMLPAASRDKPSELVVQADTATNSLLIRADGTQRKMLDELILKLDVEVVQTAREMRVVPVQFVSAAQIAQTVSQVFLKQDASSSSYRRSSYYYRSYYRSYDEPEEPTRTGADADKIVVTASPNDRSVIVEAPKLKIEPVVQLITTLDVPEGTAKPQQIRTYQLKNANAAETARILSNMYAQRQNGSVSSYGEEGSPSRTAKSKIPAPKFDHDAGSNQLVISANDEQFVEIEALIKTLDETPQLATQTKTFPLKHARASEIVPLLTSLLSDTPSSPAVGSYSRYSSRSRYGASATAGEVHVATLPGTNSVIVQGPPAKLTQAEQLISTFDTPEAGGSSLVTVIPLKNASAVTLAETLRSMLPPPVRGRPEEIVIQADSLTNSLLVRAPEDQRKTIDDLIAKLDGGLADNAQTREMRIIPVKHLSAAQLAETVSVMYQQLREARRGLRARPVDPGEQVVITPSPNDRSIVVEAPKKKVEEIAKLVADLDTEENSFQILVRTYQLKTASASELARSLTNIFAAKVAGSASPGRRPGAVPNRAGPQPTFDVDAASNQLLVAATSEQLIEIEQLIQKMDNPEVQAVQTRIFPIQHAKADELVTLLQTMLNENPPSAAYGSSAYYSRRYRPTGSSSGDDIRISTLPGTNSIVVQGPPNKLTRAEQLIKSFDTPEAAVAATVTIIPIKNASAATLVETLRAMLPPVKGRAEEVFIQADILTNSVLIRAPETQRKMVTELVAKLDTQSELTREMRVIPLTFTSATQLASALQVMYQQHMATRGGPRAKPVDPAEQVIFTPAPHDQALVVEAPKKKMEEIAALIEKLDVQESPDRLTVRTYQLAENSDAVETARTLAKLFTETRVRPGAIAGNQQQPRFEADGVGNQLIIAATPKQFEEIEPLLKKLQDSAQLAVRSKTYQLKFAKAADIVQMLQSMLTGTTGRSRYSAYGDPAAASSEVRVAAVNGSNSVFVQGPPAKLAMADELIRTFDTEQAAARSVIQIIKLKNAQAASLAQAVNATLEARAARRPYGEQAGADDGKVTVTPEPNSNSLLVRGPLAEIPSVLEMIRDLDEGGTSAKSEVRIFPIKNSDAYELSTTLGRLVQDMIAQQTRARGDVPVPAFSIAADTRTNSLIVSTTSAYFAIVEQLLENLDKEQPIRDVQYIALTNAQAVDVAEKVNALFTDRKGSDKPVIEAEEYTNSLTVIAKAVDLLTIQEMVEKLDKGRRELQVRVVPIKQIKAERMAEIIQRVYGQTTSSRVIVTGQSPPTRMGIELPAPQPTPAPPPPAGKGPAASAKPWTGSVPRPATQPATRPTTRPESAPAAKDDGELEENPPITIAIDHKSNTLIISGPPQEIDNIQGLIDQMMTSPEEAEAEFRTYRIEHADPVVLAQTLEDMFNPKPKVVYLQARTGQPAQAPAEPPPPITVQADARTRSIVVRAKVIDFDMIEPLIKYLDQETSAHSELRVFPLENTEAGEVADNLKEMFNLAQKGTAAQPAPQPQAGRTAQRGRADRVRQVMDLQVAAGGSAKVDPYSAISISANRNTNSVVVSAPKEVMKLVESIIQELDQSALQSKTVVRMYPLKHAEVTPTVSALREIFSQAARTSPLRSSRTGSTPGASLRDAPIVVTGDEVGRQIIVSAPVTQHETVAKVIQDIDTAQGVGQILVQVYRIQNAEATSVAASLSTMFSSTASAAGTGRRVRTATGGGGPRISADASSNCIVVRAVQEDHAEITRLLEELDASPADKYPVRRIPIQNASPTVLATNLRAVFAGRSGTAGGRRGGAAGRDGLVIQPDEDARMLLVRADEETYKKIEEMVQALDAVSVSDKLQTVIIPLEHGQATSVAAALSQAFGASARGGRRSTSPEDEVRIAAETFTNSILITASEKNLLKIQAMVQKLEKDTAGGVKSEFLVLTNAKADDLATVLARLAGASGRGARGAAGTGGVTVAADAAANALVFSGPAAEVAKLSTMAKQLDQAAQGSAVQVFMIPLKNNIASEVAAAIQQLHAQQAVRRGGAASREPLSVTFDDSANVVVLSTTKRQYDEISQWVTKFEELKVTREAPKIIALVNSDPQEIERALRQMFAGGSAPGGRGSRTVRTTGKVEIASLPQQRALLVKAGAEDFKLISDLVKSLDESAPTAMPKQTMVALKHAPAASVASALTAAFGPGRRGRTALARPEDEVRVVAEAASNSVIITADEKNTTAVLSLIAKLDTDEASGKAQFLILKKAKAVELARVLSAATSRGARKPGQQPLVVTADAASNALVLSGPPNDIEAAIAMATKLDEAATAGISEVFLIPLKTGQASEVAATVQQIYQQQAAATRSAGRTIDPLAVSADDSANVIILATTKVMHDQVNQWIGKVEEMKVGQGEPRLVTLENADVAEVEKAVRALFITVRATAGRGARGAAGATGARIEVASLPQQRALLIKSGEEDFKAINDLIMALDAAAVTRLNKQTIIPLKHAQATSVAPALQSAFQQQIRGRGAAVKPEDEVRIIAEPISNTLIVAASDKNTVLVQGLVAKLDTDEASGKAQFLILQKAKAVELAKVLSTVSASRSRKPGQQPLIITADVASNALVMSGSATEMDAAIKMAQELDGAASESLAQVFLITLKSGQASDVAATVQQIYQQQTAAARTAGRSIDPLAVSADDSANVLILSTTKAMHDQVNQWVQKVEEMKLNQEAPQLVTLENADVQEVEKAIRQIFVSGKVSRTGKAIGKIELAVLPQQRALLIKAGEEDFKAINELIKSLDAAAVAAKHQQTLITLKHATAASVATALTTAFGPASRGRGVTIKPEDEVRVIAEPISNTVIVVASEKNTALVQGLVAKLDTDEASGKAQFLILKKAKAVELARVLSTANSAKARKPGQQPLVITADAASNALVLSGPSNDIEAAIVMATKLDEAATAGVSEVFLIPLKTGQASEVAATVQQIYQQQAAATRSAGRTIDPLAVSADDSANVIILATTKVMHDQVNQWIGKVEEMKVGQGEPRLVTLENADVAEVEKAVRALFITARAAGGRGARGAAGATGARIEVASLPQQRALLIKSSEEDFKAISSLILSLDAAAMEAKHQQTLITLKHATAASVATALTTAFGPVSRGRGATIKPEDEVRVIAEPISNTVIVVASEKNTTLVRGLVAKLDTDEASGKAQFLILKKAKAVELARVLSTANSAKARKPGQQPLVITADAASNALVLSGPSNDIEAAI